MSLTPLTPHFPLGPSELFFQSINRVRMLVCVYEVAEAAQKRVPACDRDETRFDRRCHRALRQQRKPRPQGWFGIQEAMGLCRDPLMYSAVIQAANEHIHDPESGHNIRKRYTEQDPDKLRAICYLLRKEYYFAPMRAIEELVKRLFKECRWNRMYNEYLE
ncbi:hypothetical protein MKEN_00579200 [Mycena kentingensis (nom. inval.)]|nr:hypothetical protein MKEN_00579200 [Mycena kentingensis (nom. inval.)]